MKQVSPAFKGTSFLLRCDPFLSALDIDQIRTNRRIQRFYDDHIENTQKSVIM